MTHKVFDALIDAKHQRAYVGPFMIMPIPEGWPDESWATDADDCWERDGYLILYYKP